MTHEEFIQSLDAFVHDYGSDHDMPFPQQVAVVAMAKLVSRWEDDKISPDEMKNQARRVVQIMQAFQGRIEMLDFLQNPQRDDDDD